MANSSNNYPFLTKTEIKARLVEGDISYVLEACLIMTARQTEDEIAAKDTKHKNHRGWMSSHAVNGTNFAAKIAAGEELTDEETGKLRGMVSRYSKQLAQHYRQAAIKAYPELAEAGKVFGV